MELSIIIFCLILSAFFSGMEIAFISSNKVYLGIEKMQDNFSSKILTKLTQNPSKFIAVMLIGNNLALIIYAFFAGNLTLKWLTLNFEIGPINIILVQILVTTFILIFTSEFLPKIFFQIYANTLMKILAIPAYFFYKLFFYVANFVIFISDFILRKLFNTNGDPEQLFFSKIELGNYITEQMNAVEDKEEVDFEIQIFQNALEFTGVKAREIMNPRTEIAAVEVHDTIQDLKALFIATGYSKIIVYQNSLDDIIGYVHSFELFKNPKTIKSVMISAEFVPETMLIKDTMNLLSKKRKSVAVVLDEYGGTSGIVTIEDIVEQLFGEIDDEHDSDAFLIEKKLSDNIFIFSTRFDVEFINAKYKLQLPQADSYSTLGGLIVSYTNNIPEKGDHIQIENYHFVIEEATNKKIERIKLTIKD